MYKLFILLIGIALFKTNINAQCGIAQDSIVEDFNTGINPSCWVTYSGFQGIQFIHNKLEMNNINGTCLAVLPKVKNVKGILVFDGFYNTLTGAATLEIGAMPDSLNQVSFTTITTVTLSVSQQYTIDLSSYTGGDEYLAIRLSGGGAHKRAHIDNLHYTVGCISTNVSAVAKDTTFTVGSSGTLELTGADLDDGSTTSCGVTPDSLSLNQSLFTCADTGVHNIILTAKDMYGNISYDTAAILIKNMIKDESVQALNSVVCEGDSTSILTGSSVQGVNYYLRDNQNTILQGPLAGTGSSLSFSTGALMSAQTYNVWAEPASPAIHALNFDGVDDYVSLGTDNRGITTQVTLAAWVKTTASGSNQFLASKYNGVNGFVFYMDGNGKVNIDGRDGAGAYRQSGPSTTSVNDNQWHYVTGTVDIITGLWSVYVDGVLEKSTNHGAGTSLATPVNLTLGVYSTFYFTGAVDQFTVWNQALGAATIQNTMNNCLSDTAIALVGLYNLDEGTGMTAQDHSTSNIQGALTNMLNGAWGIGTPNLCFTTNNTCDKQLSQTVTVSINPTIDTTVALSGIMLTANQAGATYQWLDCNNNNAPIIGENNQSFTPIANGDYAVEITVNGCTDTSTCQSITITGGEDLPSEVTQVYPNPVKNILNIVANQAIENIIIYNINGVQVRKMADLNGQSIDVSMLENGLYILELTTSQQIIRKHFIKN
ncbi:MAG: T9SS type A sorting domain-containing protein [Aureispira sp.]|nr:T9SS type A sorting domain-containing protein [Aureispira sp.]